MPAARTLQTAPATATVAAMVLYLRMAAAGQELLQGQEEEGLFREQAVLEGAVVAGSSSSRVWRTVTTVLSTASSSSATVATTG